MLCKYIKYASSSATINSYLLPVWQTIIGAEAEQELILVNENSLSTDLNIALVCSLTRPWELPKERSKSNERKTRASALLTYKGTAEWCCRSSLSGCRNLFSGGPASEISHPGQGSGGCPPCRAAPSSLPAASEPCHAWAPFPAEICRLTELFCEINTCQPAAALGRRRSYFIPIFILPNASPSPC